MDRDTDAVLDTANALVDQARRIIGDQLDAVEDEAGRLERAHGHLNGVGGGTPARRPAARRPPAKSREEWEKTIVAELAKAPGTIGDLTLRLRLRKGSTTLFGPAKSALDKGLVQKDGTVYSLRAKPKVRRRSNKKGHSATKTTTSDRKSK